MSNKKYAFLSAVVATCLTISVITYTFGIFNRRIADLDLFPLATFGLLLLAVFFSVIGLIQFRILQNKGIALGGLWIYMSTLGLVVLGFILLVMEFLKCGFSACK